MIFTKENIESVDLDNLVNQKLQNSTLNEILFIVPTNRKIRYFKKELISMLPGKTTGKINIETIGTLSVKLLGGYYIFKPLSDAESSVLFKQSVSEAKLKYLSAYKKEIPAGTLGRIKNVISEYKRQGISPEKILDDAGELTGSEKLKAEDIAAVYKIYKQKCLQLNLFEIGDVYEKLIETDELNFKNIFREFYPEVDLVVINGFDEFSYPEIDIIDFISQISGVKIFINFDYFDFNPFIFSHLNRCYEKLLNKKFKVIKEKSFINQDNFIDSVRSNLFIRNINEKIDKYNSDISIIYGTDRLNEIELIAKTIKELIFSRKARPHEICVSFNLIDKYSPIIRDVFSTYGIPFNLTDRIALSASYPVIGIINLMEILENDFYYKNIFRALSSRFLNFGNINLAGLMKVAAELKIIAGYDNWINSLKDAVRNLENDTEIEQTEFEKKRELFAKAIEDISVLAEILSPFTRKLSLSEFPEKLKLLIYKLDIPKNLIREMNGREEESIRGMTTFLETLDEIFGMLQIEYGKDKKFPLHFFLEQIRIAVSTARFNVKEKSDFGVQVTTVNEIRGLRFDYLFISGLCDGDFPTRFDPEIFLTGSFAKSENIHQTDERYHFYQAICVFKKKLFLTCPLQENNKELVQSSFLKDFISLYEFNEITPKDFERSVYSVKDLQILVGRHGLNKVKEEFKNFTDQVDWQAIEHSLKVAGERAKDPFGESVYNGFLNPPHITYLPVDFILSDNGKEKLKKLSEREYSVTQLEQYAKCPYQYFIKRVLNIDIIKEPTEEIEAFELGTLLHSILYKFYKVITEKKLVVKNCPDNLFNIFVDLIFKIAEEEVESASFNSPFSFFEKEKILGIDGNRINSILYKFLETERADKSSSDPKYFELAFGKMKNEKMKNEISLDELKLGEVKVRGKIDRLEINDAKNQFNVVDYKIGGRKPGASELQEGLSIQLPLYLYAASQMIKAKFGTEYDPANAFIYSLKFNADEFGKSSISIKRGKSFDDLNEQKQKEVIEYNNELIKICEESIQKYVEGIKAGKFNLSLLEDREQKVCRYCDFRSICRIQEAL